MSGGRRKPGARLPGWRSGARRPHRRRAARPRSDRIGDPIELAEALGGDIRRHERFATATVEGPRAESTSPPREQRPTRRLGPCPTSSLRAIEADLARRDFTVNAIAVAARQPGIAIDPHGGADDLRAGVLRVLHRGRSSTTRRERCGPPATRRDSGWRSSQAPARWSRRPISQRFQRPGRGGAAARRRGVDPRPAFELLDEWGLIALEPGGERANRRRRRLARTEPWAQVRAGRARPRRCARAERARSAPRGRRAAKPLGRGFSRRWIRPGRAGAGARARRDVARPLHLGVGTSRARDLGGRPDRGGRQRGSGHRPWLEAALRAKLDGETSGRDDELRLALDAAEAR